MSPAGVEHPSRGRVRIAVVGALAALICVILLQPVFIFSLAFVRAHTDLDPVRRHIAAAFEQGVLGADEVPRQIIHRYGHQFTECAALHLAIDDEKDVMRAVLAPQLHSKYVGPCGELQRTASGIATSDRTDYSRYWHGYRLYIWPLLEHVGLSTMRLINAVLLVATVAVFFTGLRTVIGATPSTVFLIVLMSLTDIWRIWRITPHFLSMIVILAGTALFARLYMRQRQPVLALALAAALGAVFNFVDFLVNPPMMPMLLAFVVLATDIKDRQQLPRASAIDTIWIGGLTALAWFGGYALTWVTKWLLAVWLAADASQSQTAILNQILLRLYGQEPDSPIFIVPLLPTLTMILQSFISAGSIAVAILAAAIFLHVRKNWATFDRWRFLLLLSPTLISTLWFELLSNHTQTHSHFTYRSESAAIAIFFSAALMAAPGETTLKSLLANLGRGLRRA